MSRPLYQQASSSASSSSITPTSQPPPPPPPLIKAKTTLRRGKTLTRPERQVAQPPLITPPAPLVPGGSLLAANQSTLERKRDWWVYLSLVTTFWAPPALLASVGGMRDSATRQAWREKITLVGVAVVIAGAVAFVTMGLDRTFCPGGAARGVGQMKPFNNTPGEKRSAHLLLAGDVF
jgi:chitin synthase